jgi:hypothetical protein
VATTKDQTASMLIGILLSRMEGVVIIIARWLKTTMAAAAMVPSALVVAKVTLKSLYASQEDKRESHQMRFPFLY